MSDILASFADARLRVAMALNVIGYSLGEA